MYLPESNMFSDSIFRVHKVKQWSVLWVGKLTYRAHIHKYFPVIHLVHSFSTVDMD